MFIRRLLAYLIDVIPITFLTAFVFWHISDFNEVWLAYAENRDNVVASADFNDYKIYIRNVAAILSFFYFVIFEVGNTKNTLGKALLGLKVVNLEGNSLTLQQSLQRNTCKFFSIIPYGLGLLFPVFNKEHLFLHDYLVGTRVIRTR